MACSRENLLLRRLSLMGTQFLLQFMTFTMKQYESPRVACIASSHKNRIASRVLCENGKVNYFPWLGIATVVLGFIVICLLGMKNKRLD